MSLKTKYTVLDAAILATIKNPGRSDFRSLLRGVVASECHRIAESEGQPEPTRILDRRLQQMRKRNLISFDPVSCWSLVPPKF